MFLTGALIYGWALRAFSLENSTIVVDPDPIFWAMILSQLVMGGFLAYIYGNRASISTFSGGARVGALIGLFLGVGVGFDLYSLAMVTLKFTLVDPVLWMIRFAIAGGVVGNVFGTGKSEE